MSPGTPTKCSSCPRSALVFYRDAAHRFTAFQQDAPYLFDPAALGLADYDSGLRTIECTKRAAVFGLWGMWAMFGPQLFADLIDVTFALGKTFYEKLLAAPDFVPLHEPECNIVVFRYVPEHLRGAPAEVLGRFQMDLRRRIIESGRFYIVFDADRRRGRLAGDDNQSTDHGGAFGGAAGDDTGCLSCRHGLICRSARQCDVVSRPIAKQP